MSNSAAEIVAKLSQVGGTTLLAALAQAILSAEKNDDAAKICPHCGFNLIHDRLMIKDGYILDPRGQVFYGEKQIKLTATELHILATIMKNDGRTMEYSTLSARTVNARRSDDRLLLRQHIHNMRKKMAEAEAPFPIKPEQGVGYYWNVDKET